MFVDDPLEGFKPNSRSEVTNIYENVFKEIIKIYTFKNNYSTLPAYLNYKIIKSNVNLEKFFVIKTIENKGADFEDNLTKIISFLSKNFDKYLVQYSTYSTHLLLKLQMIVFYNLQPPQASISLNHDPVFESSEYDLVYKEIKNENYNYNPINDMVSVSYASNPSNNIVNNDEENYIRFFENPFMSRLKKPDIVPNQNLKIEIVKSNIFN